MIESYADMEGSKFIGNTAESFADIHAQGNSEVKLKHAKFENSKSWNAGPACIKMR